MELEEIIPALSPCWISTSAATVFAATIGFLSNNSSFRLSKNPLRWNKAQLILELWIKYE